MPRTLPRPELKLLYPEGLAQPFGGLREEDIDRKALGDILGPLQGDSQFDNIVRFMSGHAPGEIPEADWGKPGTEKCIALVYEGMNAVSKIRDVLGPTDPSKAPPGSIRREFGSTIMVIVFLFLVLCALA